MAALSIDFNPHWMNFGAFRESAYDMIEAVETDGDRSVTVRWKQPYIEADNLFSPERVVPMPRHLLEKTFLEDKASFTQIPYWNEGFISSGPYRVARWTSGTGVTLQAFDGFALGRPKIDEIEVKFIPNPASLAAAILAGTIDLTIGRTLSLEQAVDVRDRWQAGLVRADEHEIGFHPPLQAAVVPTACGKDEQAREGERAGHLACPPPNSSSTCARISAATSSGSWRSNRLFQRMATMPGATRSCGKRMNTSVDSSPRSIARRINPRIAARIRATTSR